MKKTIIMVASVITAVSLWGCDQQSKKQIWRVGAMSGPEAELVDTAQAVMKKAGDPPIQVVTFNSYNIPNAALAEGSINANVFQHLPFLTAQIKARGYRLVSVGKTFIYPMGLYSSSLHSLSQLKNNSKIAIPNDPSNEGRALLLCQAAGLITLKAGAGFSATPLDIARNPKHLQFVELAAAQLPRSLSDVALAAINTTFAKLAGLSPTKDALYRESTHSPYANLIVVKKGDQSKPIVKDFIRAMHSKAVLQKAKELFGDLAIPAWDIANSDKK